MKIYHSFNELYQNTTPVTVSNLAVFNKAVQSSLLMYVKVDKKTGDLIAGFYDGAIFGYKVGGQGQQIMDNILAADSKGSYFYHNVMRSYPFYKIRGRSPYHRRHNIPEKVADWVWRMFK